MQKDPIVAEVREAREEMIAEFDYDLHAYAAHLRVLEKEARTRGVRYSDRPLAQPRQIQTDAA